MKSITQKFVMLLCAAMLLTVTLQPVSAAAVRTVFPIATDAIELVASRNYQSDNLAQDDQYIYPSFSSLSIVDINPDSLKLFYKFRTDYIYDLVIKGQYAFAGQQTAGLRVFDITVATPTIFSSHTIPGGAYGMALYGDRLLVTTGPFGLMILDTTKPFDMPQVAQLSLDGFSKQISINGSLAVVAVGKNGAHVIDLTNPDSPAYITTIDGECTVESATLVGSTAYLACGLKGMRIVDLKNPKAPMVLASLKTMGFVRQIAIKDNLAYLAERDAGIQIVDVSDSSSPQPLALYNTPGGAWDVTLKDNNIYVADYPYGLLVLRYNPPVVQEISIQGGEISSTIDKVNTTIPKDGFYSDVIFRHEPLPAINTPIGPEPTLVKVGSFFRNSAWKDDIQVKPENNYSISIAVNTDGLTGRQKQFISLYYRDPEIKRWQRDVSSRLDIATSIITATPSHLGIWGVFYDRRDVFSPISVEEPISIP
ncbi:MAG: hypothetical protein WCG34_06630 [Leptolinea sp.]